MTKLLNSALISLDGAWVSSVGMSSMLGLDTCGQGNNSGIELCYLICFAEMCYILKITSQYGLHCMVIFQSNTSTI